MSEKIAVRLRRAGLTGRTVVLKVRFADFTTITRSRTVTGPLDVGRDIYLVAQSLLTALGLQRTRLRLVGVRVEGLRPEGQSTSTRLGARDQGWREAEEAMDRAATRFGKDSVQPARLVRRRPWTTTRIDAKAVGPGRWSLHRLLAQCARDLWLITFGLGFQSATCSLSSSPRGSRLRMA